MFIWQRFPPQFVTAFIGYAKDLISYTPVSRTRLFPAVFPESPLLSLRVEILPVLFSSDFKTSGKTSKKKSLICFEWIVFQGERQALFQSTARINSQYC